MSSHIGVTVDGKPIVEVLTTLQNELQVTNRNQVEHKESLNNLDQKTVKSIDDIYVIIRELQNKVTLLTDENIELRKKNEAIEGLRNDIIELQNRPYANPSEIKYLSFNYFIIIVITSLLF